MKRGAESKFGSVVALMLSSLPSELVLKIFTYLNARDALACSAVNRRFLEIVQNDITTQYHIALQLAGLVDGNSGRPVSELLRLLIDNQRRWYNFDLKADRQQAIDVGSQFQYQMHYDSIFAQLERPKDMNGRQIRELSIFELPSVCDPGDELPPPARKRTMPLDFTQIPNMLLDNAQDLLVFAQVDVDQARVDLHLRTISENTPHPQALVSILSIPRDGLVGHMDIFEDSFGSVSRAFSAVGSPGWSKFDLWNWKTGVHFTSVKLDDLIGSFTFWSRTRVVVATAVDDDTQIQLRVYDSVEGGHGMTLTTIFMLPVLTGVSVTWLALSGSWPTTDRPVHRPPHHGSFESRLFLLEITIRDRANARRVFNLVIPRGALHRDQDAQLGIILQSTNTAYRSPNTPPMSLESHGRDCDLSGIETEHESTTSQASPSPSDYTPKPTVIPWEEWGPHATRLVDLEDVGSWKSAQHGGKYVRPVRQHRPRPSPSSVSHSFTRRESEPPNHNNEEDGANQTNSQVEGLDRGAAEPLRYHIQFMDFNVRSLALHYSRVFSSSSVEKQEQSDELSPVRLVDMPTVIDNADIFEEVVRTSLPYLVKTTSECFEFSTLFVDQKNILGLEDVPESGTLRGFTV